MRKGTKTQSERDFKREVKICWRGAHRWSSRASRAMPVAKNRKASLSTVRSDCHVNRRRWLIALDGLKHHQKGLSNVTRPVSTGTRAFFSVSLSLSLLIASSTYALSLSLTWRISIPLPPLYFSSNVGFFSLTCRSYIRHSARSSVSSA